MARLLNQDAWQQGDSPNAWPRSRYSGAALYPGEMAVTIVISWEELFGHAFVVFEWFDDEIPAPQTEQRRHEIYQLVAQPTVIERAVGIEQASCCRMLSWRTRPASVELQVTAEFFPLRDASGRAHLAYFRSWMVPFTDGWKARSKAAADVAQPPRYQYFERNGGVNCARWALNIAKVAGIHTQHIGSRIVAVPKWLIRPEERIDTESAMWRRRTQSRDRLTGWRN